MGQRPAARWLQVGGILTEATGGFVIVGIGINLNTPVGFSYGFTACFLACSAVVYCTFKPESAAAVLLHSCFPFGSNPRTTCFPITKSPCDAGSEGSRHRKKQLFYRKRQLALDGDAALLVLKDGRRRGGSRGVGRCFGARLMGYAPEMLSHVLN
jgi:hypothetical protein